MADFAAERAALARPASAPAVPPKPKTRKVAPARTLKRQERVGRYLDAIRASSSHREAAEALGVGKHSLEMFVSDLRRRGELPDDVEQLLRERNPARRTKSNGASGSPRPARPKDTPPLEAVAAADVESQGPEADAPATAVASSEPPATATPAEPGATPPGQIDASPMHEMHPDSPQPVEGPPVGVYLSLTIDVVRLAQEMRSWSTYQIAPFLEGIAKIIHEVQAP